MQKKSVFPLRTCPIPNRVFAITSVLYSGLWLTQGLLVTPLANADPFSIHTSPRAAAMAGAYVALADDGTSVWYNPAGFAGLPKKASDAGELADYDMSFSSTHDIESDASIGRNGNALFVGGRYSTAANGIGLYYYQPYNFEYSVPQTDGSNVWGDIKQSLHILSIPMAAALSNGKVRFGGTLELVSQYADETDIRLQDDSGFIQRYNLPETHASSYSGSVATQVKLLDSSERNMRVNLGAVYRFKSEQDASFNTPYTTLNSLLLAKPQSFDLGVAGVKELSSGSVITLSTQYGQSEWEDNQSYTKFAIGGEYQFPQSEWRVFLQPIQAAVQFGYSNATASVDDPNLNWPDVSTLTLGTGFAIGKKWHVALAAERKTAEPISGSDSSKMYYSFGLNWAPDL